MQIFRYLLHFLRIANIQINKRLCFVVDMRIKIFFLFEIITIQLIV